MPGERKPHPPSDTLTSFCDRLPLEFCLPESASPARLDAALALLLPDLGLRARKRLWEWCRVSVNGKTQKPGAMTRPGDCVAIHPLDAPDFSSPPLPSGKSHPLRIAAANEHFIALVKRAGLHSAHIAGSRSTSLESEILRYWQEIEEEVPVTGREYSHTPFLLTRLDRETSGLVLAARDADTELHFRVMEKQGKVQKTYFALAHGLLEQALSLRSRLNTDDRKRSRVLAEEDPDPVRHTDAYPLHILGEKEISALGLTGQSGSITLLRVDIRRGARHQIRAHMAAAGFPLVGETLYAPEHPPSGGTLFLHHARIRLPGFSAQCLPEWGSPDSEEDGILHLLRMMENALKNSFQGRIV